MSQPNQNQKPKPEPRRIIHTGTQNAIYAFMVDHPNKAVTSGILKNLSQFKNIPLKTLSATLSGIHRNQAGNTPGVEKISRGLYKYVTKEVPVEQTQVAAPTPVDPQHNPAFAPVVAQSIDYSAPIVNPLPEDQDIYILKFLARINDKMLVRSQKPDGKVYWLTEVE